MKVKPNSRASELTEQPDGTWVARVKAPPVDGRANAELARMVAAKFDVRRSDVTIKSGAGGRLKLIQISA